MKTKPLLDFSKTKKYKDCIYPMDLLLAGDSVPPVSLPDLITPLIFRIQEQYLSKLKTSCIIGGQHFYTKRLKHLHSDA